jgi:hypothetical protein
MTIKPTERPRRTPTDDEIPSMLEALAVSGGNTAAFAREHGLAPWKLYEAQRVAAGGRRRRRRRADRGFVPVRMVEEHPAPSAPLELMLGSGQRLLIPFGFDETTLQRVMGVLTSC